MCCLTADNAIHQTLAEVRRANLHGRLYLYAPCPARQYALKVLGFGGIVANIPPTRTCLGGWYLLPCVTVRA